MIINIDCSEHKIVGQPRPRFCKRGNFVHTYSGNKNSNELKKHIQNTVRGAYSGRTEPFLKGAIQIHMTFNFIRKSRKESGYNTKSPDGDNVEKLVLDALNGVVYEDDSQVVVCTWQKSVNVAEKECIILGMSEVN